MDMRPEHIEKNGNKNIEESKQNIVDSQQNQKNVKSSLIRSNNLIPPEIGASPASQLIQNKNY